MLELTSLVGELAPQWEDIGVGDSVQELSDIVSPFRAGECFCREMTGEGCG